MKKFIGLFCCSLMLALPAFAQEGSPVDKKDVVKPARDFFMLMLTYENWNNTPDHVRITGLGRGINAYLAYDFPISNSTFSFAAGIGISNSNIYFDDQVAVLNRGADSIRFMNVDTTAGTNFYKKSKLSTTYLEAPFEIRFYANKANRNRGFKAAVGMRVGLLMGTSSKTRHSAPDMPSLIVEKANSNRYTQKWRFAPTVRIGWGNFSLYGSYNLSPYFNTGQGPEVFPYSVGIAISGL